MIRHLITIVVLLFLTSCCCSYDDEDFEFTSNHNQLIQPYSKGDTIYFSSQSGDLDTFMISAIDTLQQCGCIMVGNRRVVSIDIKHLPENNWTGGTELSQENKPPKVLDQELIVIEKMLDRDKEEYFIGLNYRDFMGEITSFKKFNTDTLFEEYEIDKYFTIDNSFIDSIKNIKNPLAITKIFWTEKYGLAGYELKNGEIYKIRK